MIAFEGSRPIYQQLAVRLREEIENGRYPVGTLMPPETEISALFNVSRATVREAIRRLQIAGLVSRKAGVGTRIVSKSPVATYSQLGSSIEELVENARSIRMIVNKTEDIVADEALTAVLECRLRQKFLRLEGVVHAVSSARSTAKPFYWVEIYVAEAYAGIRNLVTRHSGLVASLIEQHYDEPITEIRQKITATTVSKPIAKILSVSPNTPALHFQRWYYGRNESLMQVTQSVRPADRFAYCTSLKRAGL
jgi:GntR family transcriptional regulator